MHTVKNFQTKKALVEAVKAGERVEVFQPGGIFPGTATGKTTVEGPHGYHKWYAAVEVVDYVIVKVK